MPKLIVAAHYLPVDTRETFHFHENLAENGSVYANGNTHHRKSSFKETDSRPSSFYGDEESILLSDSMTTTFGHLRVSEPNHSSLLSRIHSRKAYSALYSAIRHLEATESCIWVGVPSIDVPEEHQPTLKKLLIDHFRCYPIFINQLHHQGHYHIYCRTILWPVLHYMVWDCSNSTTQEHKSAFEKYYMVNKMFAEMIVELYQPGDDSEY
jgi:trehalose-6-phosphate synthase